MKKINNKGFVLAETLVVSIFLLIIFTMIYSYYYPLIGEYEKRETYNDVDSLYSAYWIKKMIEDSSYSLEQSFMDNRSQEKYNKKINFDRRGYFRFECSDISSNDQKREMCKRLVKELEVERCDNNGDGCNIFITKYKLAGEGITFKTTVRDNLPLMYDGCAADARLEGLVCSGRYIGKCQNESPDIGACVAAMHDNVFSSGFQDYINSLPDYTAGSLTNAKYRVIVSFLHKRDNNNYVSYATIEVNK